MTKPEMFPPFVTNVEVPFQRISAFVRQVTHDVRNSLNAMDLQAAYVQELVEDPEASEEVKRLRAQIHQSAKTLQALSANFWMAQPSLVSYSAKIFVEDFRDRLGKKLAEESGRVDWHCELGEEMISIDIEMIFAALSEIFVNAIQFAEAGGKVFVRTFAEDEHVIIDISEPCASAPSSPEMWGMEPFVTTRRGAYGLGVFRARMILSAHHGELVYHHDYAQNLLTARFILPIVH